MLLGDIKVETEPFAANDLRAACCWCSSVPKRRRKTAISCEGGAPSCVISEGCETYSDVHHLPGGVAKVETELRASNETRVGVDFVGVEVQQRIYIVSHNLAPG